MCFCLSFDPFNLIWYHIIYFFEFLQMKQLDELGCPSLWLGYGGKVPERLYSPQMEELANDSIFTNYVVSKMVNKIGIEFSVPCNSAYFFCLAITV